MALSDHETREEQRDREKRLKYYTRVRPGGASSKEIDKMVDSLEVNIPILRSLDEMERIISLGDPDAVRTVHIDPYADAPESKRRKRKGKKK